MLIFLHVNFTTSFTTIQETCSKQVIRINTIIFITFHISVCGLGWPCFVVFNFKLFFCPCVRSSKTFPQFLMHTFYSHQHNKILGSQTEKVKKICVVM